MTLHMRCKDCNFLDIIEFKKGKSWKCPNCEFNRPERSKREDFDFYGKPIIDTLFDDNGNLIQGCGALNTMET